MPLIQQNSGSVNLNATLVTSLPAAATAGNSILIFVNGAGTITTPPGFVSRSPLVSTQGCYLFEKLIASGNASDTPTLTMSGAYNATWQIAEYSNLVAYDTSSGVSAGGQPGGAFSTNGILTSAGNKRLIAFRVATMSSGAIPTAGDPQNWTNGFIGQNSIQKTKTGTETGNDYLISGWADHLVEGGSVVSTSSTVTGLHFPAAIIASYATTEVPGGGGEPIFRTMSSVPYASRTNSVVPVPIGTQDKDILIAVSTAHVASVTPPAGFNYLAETEVADSGGFNVFQRVYWKRANAESGTYTFTHPTGSAELFVAAFAKCIQTGSPIDVYSKAYGGSGGIDQGAGVSNVAVASSITTTVDNTRLLYISHDWEGTGTLVPPAGFTERHDALSYLADSVQPTAGATGTVQHTQGSNAPWAAWLIALKPQPAVTEPATGTGTLTTTASTATATGVSRSSGAGPFVPSAVTVAGVGASRSLGTALLANGAAASAGAGKSGSAVTSAALLASLSSLQGIQGVIVASGTGDVPAQSSDLSGTGKATSSGAGALVAASHALSGTGRSASVGTAALIAPGRVLSGAGVIIPATSGAGVLVAQPARIVATDYKVIGDGVLISGASTLAGIGHVPVWIIEPLPEGYPGTASWMGTTAMWRGATACWTNPGTRQWRNPGIAPPPR